MNWEIPCSLVNEWKFSHWPSNALIHWLKIQSLRGPNLFFKYFFLEFGMTLIWPTLRDLPRSNIFERLRAPRSLIVLGSWVTEICQKGIDLGDSPRPLKWAFPKNKLLSFDISRVESSLKKDFTLQHRDQGISSFIQWFFIESAVIICGIQVITAGCLCKIQWDLAALMRYLLTIATLVPFTCMMLVSRAPENWTLIMR